MSNETSTKEGALVARQVPALAYEGLSFAYPRAAGEAPLVLQDLSWEVTTGAFALLTGGTGSGKTTLLRLAKPEVAPVGSVLGTVSVCGKSVADLAVGESAQLVGYVFQSPDNQIVCDTVWHEMAFGLENLGLPLTEMRRRLSETCIFLGIEPLFRRRCDELSGGQRQIVALAAVLAMRPQLLLLDEPTAMLDPVAEKEFLSLVFRANRELGITVVVATHDPAPMAAYATCAFELKDGAIREAEPSELCKPRTISGAPCAFVDSPRDALVLHDVWQRYDRATPWVLRGCELLVAAGEVRALVGGNGSGKSTLLGVAAGTVRARRGRVGGRLLTSRVLLPQEPKALLGCETVREELVEWSKRGGYGEAEVNEALDRLGLSRQATRHPYDLSGGQQQLLALEKLLLTKPRLLLLDEPTKGLDAASRESFAKRVRELAQQGCAVILSSHDMAFVRSVAHSVSLLFDGQTGDCEPADEFFDRSWMWRP